MPSSITSSWAVAEPAMASHHPSMTMSPSAGSIQAGPTGGTAAQPAAGAPAMRPPATRPPVVLASASPRRLDLLRQIGLEPDRVDPPAIDESHARTELPRAYA